MTKFKKGDVVEYAGNGDIHVVLKYYSKDHYVDTFNVTQGFVDGYSPSDFLPTKKKSVAVVTREIDGFDAYAFKQGGKTVIAVGCRVFAKLKEARKHWSNDSDGYHYNDLFYKEVDRTYREQSNTKRLKATEKLVAKLKEIA